MKLFFNQLKIIGLAFFQVFGFHKKNMKKKRFIP
jgi:hypothetical protein